jgi:hypothetical protein
MTYRTKLFGDFCFILIMKRFSETDKWKDEWFSSLLPLEKLVWLFIIDNCDNAGFFELNKRINSFLIGITEAEYLGAIMGLNRGLLGAKNNEMYFVKKFLFHQKNLPLNSENNAHKQIIQLIENRKHLFDYNFKDLGANQGLNSPTGKGKGNSKGKVNSKEKKQKIHFSESEIFDAAKFKETFSEWSKAKLRYYYDSVLAWSNEGNKKIDWIATVRNWEARDAKEGKLKFEPDVKDRNNIKTIAEQMEDMRNA